MYVVDMRESGALATQFRNIAILASRLVFNSVFPLFVKSPRPIGMTARDSIL